MKRGSGRYERLNRKMREIVARTREALKNSHPRGIVAISEPSALVEQFRNWEPDGRRVRACTCAYCRLVPVPHGNM